MFLLFFSYIVYTIVFLKILQDMFFIVFRFLYFYRYDCVLVKF